MRCVKILQAPLQLDARRYRILRAEAAEIGSHAGLSAVPQPAHSAAAAVKERFEATRHQLQPLPTTTATAIATTTTTTKRWLQYFTSRR